MGPMMNLGLCNIPKSRYRDCFKVIYNFVHQFALALKIESHKYIALLLTIGGTIALTEIYYGCKSVVLCLARTTQVIAVGLWLIAVGYSAQFDLDD